MQWSEAQWGGGAAEQYPKYPKFQGTIDESIKGAASLYKIWHNF